MGQNKITAIWSLSLDVDCPHCDHYFNILNEVYDWYESFETCEQGDIENFEVTCPECKKEFQVNELIY